MDARLSLFTLLSAAVLLFWAVGAYNRLVGLRSELLRAIVAVDAQFHARQAVLRQWAEGLAGHADAQALAALQAACRQAETACAHARARPARSGTVVSLRLAEEILGQARATLRTSGEPLKAELAELAEADTALAFARRQFNETAQVYNRAVSQFPTWVIAGLFGFRKAGTL